MQGDRNRPSLFPLNLELDRAARLVTPFQTLLDRSIGDWVIVHLEDYVALVHLLGVPSRCADEAALDLYAAQHATNSAAV
jgi:hypothetical protein